MRKRFKLLSFIFSFWLTSSEYPFRLNHVKLFVPYFSLFKVRRPSNFADFYAYAFRYCLTGNIKFCFCMRYIFCCFSFTFHVCLTFVLLFNAEEKQKSIDIETICQLLEIVMGSTFRAQVDYFVEYLKVWDNFKSLTLCNFQNVVFSHCCHLMIGYICLTQIQNDYKVINMDQWMGLYRFCNEVCFLILLVPSLAASSTNWDCFVTFTD